MYLMMSSMIRPDWPAPQKVKAIQTTRRGDLSQNPPYADFNLSDQVGGDNHFVAQNLQHLQEYLPAKVSWLDQVHGVEILDLPSEKVRNADGAFTTKEKVVCAIRTADCLPILFTDDKGSFVAAIHAGWRSLGLGIVEKAIKKMTNGNKIMAWLGPCISPNKFEVGRDVFNCFVANDPSTEGFFKLHNNKFLLDLPGVAHLKLKKLGVDWVYGNGITQEYCTYQQADTFFSYRREKNTGRMATLAWIDSN